MLFFFVVGKPKPPDTVCFRSTKIFLSLFVKFVKVQHNTAYPAARHSMSSSFTLLTFAQHREYTIPDIIRDMKYNHIDTYRDKKYASGIFKL